MMRFGGRLTHCLYGLVLAAIPAGLAAWHPAEMAAQERAGDTRNLFLRAGITDPARNPPKLEKALSVPSEKSSAGKSYSIVQFDAPLSEKAYASLREQGWEFLEYIPHNAYIVRTDSVVSQKDLKRISGVRWGDALRAGYKIEPELLAKSAKSDRRVEALAIVWQGESRARAAGRLEALGADVLSLPEAGSHELILMRLLPEQLDEAAALGEIEWIESAPRPEPRNDVVTWAVQSGVEEERPLWDSGLTGENQIIGHIDDPIDLSSCFFRDDSDTPVGPDHRKIAGFRGLGIAKTHGTHTAGTAAGRRVDGSLDDAGHAPDARLSHSSVGLLPQLSRDEPQNQSDLAGLFAAAKEDGAAIHTNSWGEDGRRNYTYFCVAIDTFTWENPDSLVLFAATNRSILFSPENAKNVLAVGSSFRPPHLDSISTGGRGPTFDGRRKPEIFVPGTETVSAGLGDCQTTALSGTSMACPAVAGVAALVRQYYQEGWYPTGTRVPADGFTPSGALLKATLLNAAQDMEVPGYPNFQEGWGRLVADHTLYFQGRPRRLFIHDSSQSGSPGLATNERFSFPLVISEEGDPLRLTLAWHGPPVSHSASLAAVNNLDLVLEAPTGKTYYGNVFDNGVSRIGGEGDALNNVEQILLEDPEPGLWEATVIARSVDMTRGRQGFSVAATGPIGRTALVFDKPAFRTGSFADLTLQTETDRGPTAPVNIETTDGDREQILMNQVRPGYYQGSIALLRGTPSPGDGFIVTDDGEGLIATFQDPDTGNHLDSALIDNTPPEVENLRVTRNYGDRVWLELEISEPVSGDLFAGIEPGSRAHREEFKLVPGTSNFYQAFLEGLVPEKEYNLFVEMEDIAGNQVRDDRNGAFYQFVTAKGRKTLSADFNGTTDGFSSDTRDDGEGWGLSETNFARSPLYTMHAANAPNSQDASLVSPWFEAPDTEGLELRFWHSYEFEQGAWDGGVLEIQPSAGSDWIDLGPYLLEGGYNGELLFESFNPLAGRPAWINGETGTMTLVSVALDSFAGGQARVRWRLGADGATGAEGWYVDDVEVRFYIARQVTPLTPATGWMCF